MPPLPPLSWADAPPYHYHGTTGDTGGGGPDLDVDGARSLWIGGLLHWMNEDYLYCCFTRSPELLSLVIIRNKQTGESESYGFLNFSDHTAADQILKSYNGQKMPNADQEFNLNWAAQPPAPEKHPDQDLKLDLATQQDAPQRHTDDAPSDHAIFVGDLSSDVTDFMLLHLFKSRYPSVKNAKVIYDKASGRSKGYGFVRFGDVNEQIQAMTEMNGAYCSTRPMRIGSAPNKKNYVQNSDEDPTNSRLFVGCIDESITDEDLKQAFSPYGELVDVKILAGKNCGFVTFSDRASAVEAIRMLNGTELGNSTIRISWGRRSANKQDQRNGGRYGRPRSFDHSGFGRSPQDPDAYAQTGHPVYGF